MLQNRGFPRALPVSLCLLTSIVLAACGGGYTGADASMLSTSLTSSSALSVATFGSSHTRGTPTDAGVVSSPAQTPVPTANSPTPTLVAAAAPTAVATQYPTPVPTPTVSSPTSVVATPTAAPAPAPNVVAAAAPTQTPAPASISSSTPSCGVADVGN